MRPAVTVIVPTRDRPKLLRRALASVAAQQVPADAVEVIVVNDGGVAVDLPVRKAAERGLAVTAIELPCQLGLSAARNVGIANARGECLAFLDDDDVFLPQHLAVTLAAFENGDVDGVYTTCLVSAIPAEPPSAVTPVEAYDYSYCRDLLSVCNYIPVHSIVLRGLRDCGARFDPALPALEDWDMWLQLTHDHGYRLRHLPEPTVVYHKIPLQPSMTGPTATDASVHSRFSTLHQRLWRRWLPPTPKVARFRGYVDLMDRLAFRRLTAYPPLSHWYYERTLRLLADAWNGIAPETGLASRIDEALRIDPDSPQDAEGLYPASTAVEALDTSRDGDERD